MTVEQHLWTKQQGWQSIRNAGGCRHPHLVLGFGGREVLANPEHYTTLRERYPDAEILLCSTSGEILETSVYDDTLSVTAIEFAHTPIRTASVLVETTADSYNAGMALGQALSQEAIKHVFIIADGQIINGSNLVEGLKQNLPAGTLITGGLAGDGNNFQCTLVGLNSQPVEGMAAAVGLYGDRLKIGFGSVGGWDTFGPERLITRAEGNVLYELDGNSALDLYKRYLGNHVEQLPGSVLLFPLSIKQKNDTRQEIVRAVCAIDEENKTMTFAGNLPEGWYARFMKANLNRLIEGAERAAENSIATLDSGSPDLAIIVSCVGRKNIMAEEVDEEVEVASKLLGRDTPITGFYSYGEIAPLATLSQKELVSGGELHNQTMTITAFKEM
jgi:hypothetical protein